MLVIPAIDLRSGRCVRLTQGDYERERIYDGDPSEIARDFQRQGAETIHIVDLDGAKEGEPRNLEVLGKIRAATDIKIEFGGGVRSLETARKLLDSGVDRVVIGSKIIQDPAFAAQMFAAFGERVVAGLDARDGKVAIAGWTETSTIDAAELAVRLESEGAKRFIFTDIARDGALAGPNIDFFAAILEEVRVPVIASGGVSCLEDVARLSRLSLEGVIIGKALYEHRFNLSDAIATGASVL